MGLSGSKPTKWYHDFTKTVPTLEEKTVAVTGCTSGTGFILAKLAIEKNAKNLLLLNRSSERADKAEADLKQYKEELSSSSSPSSTNIETIPCDLQDFSSVRSAAEQIKAKYEAVDVLCNNAGVMALPDEATKDGYDVQMQTNHLSHFLLTKELYPLLKRAAELRGEARVVNHTSGMRKSPSTPLTAKYLEKNGGTLGGDGSSGRWERYHQSKLANSVFTLALKDKFDAAGNGKFKTAVAAPGVASTSLQATTKGSGEGSGVATFLMNFGQSAEDGTMPLAAACFDPVTESGDLWEPANRFNMVGPPTKVPMDALSSDPEARKILWEKSEEACGQFDM